MENDRKWILWWQEMKMIHFVYLTLPPLSPYLCCGFGKLAATNQGARGEGFDLRSVTWASADRKFFPFLWSFSGENDCRRYLPSEGPVSGERKTWIVNWCLHQLNFNVRTRALRENSIIALYFQIGILPWLCFGLNAFLHFGMSALIPDYVLACWHFDIGAVRYAFWQFDTLFFWLSNF